MDKFLVYFVIVGVMAGLAGIGWVKSRGSDDPAIALMHFARTVLAGVFLLFLVAIGMYFYADTAQAGAAKDVFEIFKTGMLPIVTLILGFYFGSAATKNPPTGNSQQHTRKDPP